MDKVVPSTNGVHKINGRISDTAVVIPNLSKADEINQEHLLAVQAAKDAIVHATKCGELLNEQKKRCGHGSFQHWVEEHCGFSHDTANIYMRAAKAKTSGLVFSSLRELITLQSVAKRIPKAEYIGMNPPDPKKFEVPEGHDLSAWAEFRAVAELIGFTSKKLRPLDPVAIYKGSIPQDMARLKPHLKYLKRFVTDLINLEGARRCGVNPDDCAETLETLKPDNDGDS